MLIINADDWGRSVAETDAALRCYWGERITSVSAMVFMADSERAAELANVNGLEVGLHLNFSEPFTDGRCSERLRDCHNRIVGFLTRNKYSQLLYNPFLRREFAYSYSAQADYFFDLTQCIRDGKLDRVAALAKSNNVELMTHPVVRTEAKFLRSEEFQLMLQRLEVGGYALV